MVFILMLRDAPGGSARLRRIGIASLETKRSPPAGRLGGGAGLPPSGAGMVPAVGTDTEQSGLGTYRY